MAYQIKKLGSVYEELELLDEHDNVVKTIIVNLSASAAAENISKKYIELVRANEKMMKLKNEKALNIEKAYDDVGIATYTLFEAVFGEENARYIIDFYDGRYVEMALEVTPFVISVVIPKLRNAAQDLKRKAAYKYTREKVRGSNIFKR